MKKYFIYARTACKEQNEEQDKADKQIERMMGYAKDNNLDVVKIFKDFGSERVSLKEMVERLNRGEYAGILCTSVDRLSRDYLTLAQIMRLIEEKDIEIVTPDRIYRKNAEDQLALSLMSIFAEFYAKMLAERIQRGKLQKGKQDR